MKNREAAAHSALTRIRLGAKTTGVKLGADASGNPRATDPSGASVFTGATPMMWDSTGGSGSDGPADTSKRKAMDTVVTANAVEVVPDQAMLTFAETVFPVYVDPPLNAAREGGTELWKNAPGDNNWNS